MIKQRINSKKMKGKIYKMKYTKSNNNYSLFNPRISSNKINNIIKNNNNNNFKSSSSSSISSSSTQIISKNSKREWMRRKEIKRVVSKYILSKFSTINLKMILSRS
jgi:hypothetical protein